MGRTRSLTLKLMWRGQLLLLLCWTAQTTFPYLRTSFLTASKTGWIVFLKGPLIGTCQLLARISHISLNLEQQIDTVRYPVLFSKFETCNVYHYRELSSSSNPITTHSAIRSSTSFPLSHKSLITHCDLFHSLH